MSKMDELYQSVIIEHDRSPRNFRVLPHATHHADGRNPLCGDEVAVQLDVRSDGTVADVAFQGSGCAVSRASASMMTVALKVAPWPRRGNSSRSFTRCSLMAVTPAHSATRRVSGPRGLPDAGEVRHAALACGGGCVGC